MSEDWWNERFKEWPGARKIKEKPVSNMDLMEKVFGAVHVSGAEGWTAQQGEEHLDTMHLGQDVDADVYDDAQSRQVPPTQDVDADAESRQVPPTQLHPTQGNTGNGPSSSNIGNGPSSSSRPRASKKRTRQAVAEAGLVAEVIRNSVESRDQILSHKNKLIESHPEFTCSQFRAMEVLHSLPAIRMWSPLYKASINHLKQDAANRQTFLCYEEDENKVLYLEYATGENRDA